MGDLMDRIFSLGALLVPICAILVGGAIAIIGMAHRHQERLAKIERGIDPDVPGRNSSGNNDVRSARCWGSTNATTVIQFTVHESCLGAEHWVGGNPRSLHTPK